MARKALIDKQQERIKKIKFSTRKYNRCVICGRARGFLSDFDLCRICFRNFAHEGKMPGVRKSSW
jgi:small subunit ribosomal protein S14